MYDKKFEFCLGTSGKMLEFLPSLPSIELSLWPGSHHYDFSTELPLPTVTRVTRRVSTIVDPTAVESITVELALQGCANSD